ncbi:MAG TPA: hypothetical protein VI757_15535 [Bacteroidia bacterium]|nr:hypothetical protein [Bacteroidia bacterium]
MRSRFKPKFWRDIQKIKNDKEAMMALDRVFMKVEKAQRIDEIPDIKQLEKFPARYRIKLFLDRKRDYRIGLYIHGNTVWVTRLLHRKKIYEEHW